MIFMKKIERDSRGPGLADKMLSNIKRDLEKIEGYPSFILNPDIYVACSKCGKTICMDITVNDNTVKYPISMDMLWRMEPTRVEEDENSKKYDWNFGYECGHTTTYSLNLIKSETDKDLPV
jgi:hypothetical protein